MVMTIKKRRKLLLAADTLLGACIIAAIALAMRQPAEAGAINTDTTKHAAEATAAAQSSKTQQTAAKALTWYTQPLDVPLRRPLYDPKPEPVKVIVAAPKPLRLTLVGTILEGEKSTAIVRTLKGETKFVRIGQTAENATLKSVTSDTAMFDFDGREVEISRPDDKGGR